MHDLGTHVAPPPCAGQQQQRLGPVIKVTTAVCTKETRRCRPPPSFCMAAGVKGGRWPALETLYHPPFGNYALCPAIAASSSDAIQSHLLFAILHQVPLPPKLRSVLM